MNRRQRGVTAIGWIFLLVPIAVVLFSAIRVSPDYLNYYRVVQAMKGTAKDIAGDETATAQTIRTALDRRFDTGYVEGVKVEDIDVRKEPDGKWAMTAEYERTVPLFGNLHLLMAFKHTAKPD
jgi:hypothetical protein